MRTLTAVGLSIVMFSVQSVWAWAGEQDCSLASMKAISLQSSKISFKNKFCSASNEASCDKRYENISQLVDLLANDNRITNIATASYILATVALETGSRNFSPAATEKIGESQKRRSYYPNFIGRGWVQLTHQDKYRLAGRKLNIDLVNHPELALETNNSYKILVGAMTEGWLETYRSSSRGAGGSNPIRLSDFISSSKVDYGSARAVINANCMKKPCTDIEYSKGNFIPEPANLDNGEYGAKLAKQFQSLLCEARKP